MVPPMDVDQWVLPWAELPSTSFLCAVQPAAEQHQWQCDTYLRWCQARFLAKDTGLSYGDSKPLGKCPLIMHMQRGLR